MYSFIQAIVLLQSARLAVWEMCPPIFWSVTYNYELSSSLWWGIICEQTNPAATAWLQSGITEGLTGLCSCLRTAPKIWLVVFPTPHVTGAVLLLVHGSSVDLLAKTVLQTSGFRCSSLFLITGVLPNAKILSHSFVCHLSVSPSHDSRAFLLAMSILSFLLPGLIPAWLDHDFGYPLTDLPDAWPSFWSGSICSSYWHSVVPMQSLGLFGAWYLGVFFWGLCLLMSALTSITCLRFLHELLPWFHLSPSKIRNCTKSHQKLPH